METPPSWADPHAPADPRFNAQGHIDGGRRDGLTSGERDELARLRRENRVLREERDILKRATAFFARETR